MLRTNALGIILLILCSCSDKFVPSESTPNFSQPKRVIITGYSGNSMEPFLTRDGTTLFFNNLNSAPENTNLHWATKINDTTFQYKGELTGVNTASLEGVPTMDTNGNFYFVSDRSYSTTLSSLYSSIYSNGTVSSVSLVPGVSKNIAGWLNFDVEVDAAGETLFLVDGRFDQFGGPYEADLVIAKKTSQGFQRASNSADILKNINTSALEYAACISADGLEFYFTRFLTSSLPEIFRASRKNQQDAFSIATKIISITGFVEAPTISPDGKIIYFHKNENGKFVIYCVKKM